MADQPDEKQIRLYLVGELPEADSERLDELSLADDDFAQRLRDAEDDLVDAYARGDLPPDLAKNFRLRYLASPRGRDKLKFAQALVTYAAEAAAHGVKRAPAVDQSRRIAGRSIRRLWWARSFGAGRPGWAFALGAAIALVAAAGYLTLQNIRLRAEIARSQQERVMLEQREQDLQRQIQEGQSEIAKADDELAHVRDRLAQLEEQAAARHPKPEGGGGELQVIALTLTPPTRGAGSIPALTLPSRAGIVALTLQLDSDDFAEYQATLTKPSTSQVIWRSGMLKAIQKEQKKAISIRIGSALLTPGTYSVEVTGGRKGEPSEMIGSYPFRAMIR